MLAHGDECNTDGIPMFVTGIVTGIVSTQD
jgi:hypothetical protein